MSMKNPLTLTGIEPAIFRFVGLEHGENHNKSLEECTALDVQQPTIYDSRKTVKFFLNLMFAIPKCLTHI